MNIDNPENQGVLAFLSKRCQSPLLLSPSESDADPYLGLGSHPDVVERVWDQLGAHFPPEARQIVCGTPALIRPSSGIIIAFCLGMAYVLRIPPEFETAAQEAGLSARLRWGNGQITDLAEAIGPGWVFGRWDKQEKHWLLETDR